MFNIFTIMIGHLSTLLLSVMASASVGIYMASTSQPPLKLALTVSPTAPTVSPTVPTVSLAVPTVSPTVQPDSEGRLDNVCKPNFHGN